MTRLSRSKEVSLGNRTSASVGGNAAGAGLSVLSYTANLLNQYSALTNPSRQWITGEAATAANVVVNDQPAWRHGTFFGKDVTLNNAASPMCQPVTVRANLPPSGGTMVSKSQSGNILAGPASASPTYDEDGNLANDGLWSYTWDGENRLIALETSSSLPAAARRKITGGYDFEGRLVTTSRFTDSGSGWVADATNPKILLYDGWNIVAEITASGTQEYLWGYDLSGTLDGAGGIGGYLGMSTSAGSGVALASADANGNVTSLSASADGSSLAKYVYSPFGQLLDASGAMAESNPFQWSTKYTDSECGLNYYGYRFYSSSIGRWLNRDPIEEAGGVNLYGFSGNSSLNDIDLLGLQHKLNSWTWPAWSPHARTGSPGWGDYGLYGIARAQSGFGTIAAGLLAELAYRHYLDGTGTPFYVDYGEAIEDERQRLRPAIMENLNEAIRMIDKLDAKYGIQFISSDRIRGSQTFSLKWLYVLGYSQWVANGSFLNSPNSNEVELDISYETHDPYDFNYQPNAFGGLLNDQQHRRLHDVGLRAEFLIEGQSSLIHLKWCRGQLRNLRSKDVNFKSGSNINLSE